MNNKKTKLLQRVVTIKSSEGYEQHCHYLSTASVQPSLHGGEYYEHWTQKDSQYLFLTQKEASHIYKTNAMKDRDNTVCSGVMINLRIVDIDNTDPKKY